MKNLENGLILDSHHGAKNKVSTKDFFGNCEQIICGKLNFFCLVHTSVSEKLLQSQQIRKLQEI